MLLEAPGTGYWDEWFDFVAALRDQGMVAPDDLSLFTHTNDAEEAAAEIRKFYNNYHSQRYVDGKLILRLREAPTDDVITRLNDEYADILTNGAIEKVDATPQEVADEDALDCERLALSFNRRDIGRLKNMVDELNDLVAEPPRIWHPASRFTP